MNWKKWCLYDFIEWVKDIEDNINNMFDLCNCDNDTTMKLIDGYIGACHYDYEDYKDIEDYTLEDLEKFLKEILMN